MGDRAYPAFLDLEGRSVVIIGGGPLAEKRVRQLTRYGADIIVITSSPSPALVQAQADGLMTLEPRDYVRGDLSGAFIALCVTDDAEVQRALSAEAESIGCLINVHGVPHLSSFLLPSVIHRGRLQLAVSTGGGAPEAAKALRKHLDAQLGPEWGAWVALLAEMRTLVAARVDDASEQERMIAAAAADGVRERLAAGEDISAETLYKELASSGEDDQ